MLLVFLLLRLAFYLAQNTLESCCWFSAQTRHTHNHKRTTNNNTAQRARSDTGQRTPHAPRSHTTTTNTPCRHTRHPTTTQCFSKSPLVLYLAFLGVLVVLAGVAPDEHLSLYDLWALTGKDPLVKGDETLPGKLSRTPSTKSWGQGRGAPRRY